jgi:hypothetical protein
MKIKVHNFEFQLPCPASTWKPRTRLYHEIASCVSPLHSSFLLLFSSDAAKAVDGTKSEKMRREQLVN